MKRHVFKIFFLVGLFLVLGLGPAHSALLGVSGDLDYPLIVFGKVAGAAISYDYETGVFNITAKDMTIKMDDSSAPIYLSGTGFETTLTMALTITLSGGKPSSVLGSIIEEVTKGSVDIGGHKYTSGATLISGTVYEFGWGESGDALGSFDFKIKDVTGALVSDGIWPPYGIDKRETGIYLWAEKLSGWDGSWTQDFALTKVKGQKAPIGAPPVPIPTAFLLLGSGLTTLGLLRLKKKR